MPSAVFGSCYRPGMRARMVAVDGSGGGHYSVAFPRRWWYPATSSRDLGATEPVALSLMDTPLVLFRDGTGRAHALVDR